MRVYRTARNCRRLSSSAPPLDPPPLRAALAPPSPCPCRCRARGAPRISALAKKREVGVGVGEEGGGKLTTVVLFSKSDYDDPLCRSAAISARGGTFLSTQLGRRAGFPRPSVVISYNILFPHFCRACFRRDYFAFCTSAPREKRATRAAAN